MNTKKESFQVRILVASIFGILVLSGMGYFVTKQYQNYQAEKVKKETLATNKDKTEEQQQKLQELLDFQSKELEKQGREIETLKNRPRTTTQNIEKNFTPSIPQNSAMSLADLIEYWSPNVAKINCLSDFNKSNGGQEAKITLSRNGVDTSPVEVSGSGFLLWTSTQDEPDAISIVTNRHILNTHNGFGMPYYCEAILPGGHKYIFGSDDLSVVSGEEEFGYKDVIKFFDGEPFLTYKIDAGLLRIKNPDTYASSIAKTKSNLICTGAPRIGEDVVILGYPSIGSSEGITATDGIISGLEEFYFVTSAKVEHGNSGGAAILRSKNCYLGIPTFAYSGSVESLARILSFKKIFK